MKTLLNTVYDYIESKPENDMTLAMMKLLLEAETPLLKDFKEFRWQLYLNYNRKLNEYQRINLSHINSIVERLWENSTDRRETVHADKLLDTHIEGAIT